MSGDYVDEPWFKINRRVFDSSVWEEDLATRVLWVTLLGLSQLPENRKHGHGMVVITQGNLTRKAYISAEQFAHAIARLTEPDPSSRTNPGGPRLEVLPNGYRLLNFDLYHDPEEYERWLAQRIAAGKSRAQQAARSGGRFSKRDGVTRHGTTDEATDESPPPDAGEPTSEPPAVAGSERAE
jgi:hypothetical protein